MKNIRIALLVCFLLICTGVFAEGAGTYSANDPARTVIGVVQTYKITDNDTLLDAARLFGIGFNAITEANPKVDPWIPEEGITITVPTQWIVPEILDDGILVNLAEMRLYYFFMFDGHRFLKTYPIGIGREGFNTPEGVFRITGKVEDPVWRPTKRMREETPDLDPLVPPGPDNPLGDYWLQLSIPSYGIHGTNKPYSVGRRISSGCIRLYPEDIEELFEYARVRTPVKIINEPIKAAIHEDAVYIEIHPNGLSGEELAAKALKQLSGKDLFRYVNQQLLKSAIDNPTGLPTKISR
ncbi:L,D-transpeptidase family protein [Candidatus Magnetominusculus dajiuhuensis]|uniref:L,D-transpeptidase family protein n=1 Tax=Candidatus Magnetominusculus dajiuhuensis TaxID=3137712 RepID=UPI003B434AEF